MDKQPDELILQSLRQGSYDAFDALYMRYAPHVEAFAFCMLKNRSEAEDLAHDIFLKIWETRESIGRIKSFRSYLFRMTKNAVFDIFEHKSVQTRYEQRSARRGPSDGRHFDEGRHRGPADDYRHGRGADA